MSSQKPKQGYKIVKSLFGKYEEIPKEWTTEQMKDLIENMRSGISRLLSFEDIGYPVLTSGNMQNGRFDSSGKKYWHYKDPQGVDLTEYILQDNDIILNFINSIEKIGKSCIFEKQERDWIFTTNVFRIKTNVNKVSHSYFYYLLTSKLIQKQIFGITQPAINQASFSKHFFEKIHVFLPSFREQQKISPILSNVDNLIDSYDKIIEETKKLKNGLMQQLLTKGIGHKKFKKVKWLFGKDIEIPEKWMLIRLEKLIDSYKNGIYKPDEFYGKGIPNIRMFNIQDGKINKNNVVLLDVTKKEAKDYELIPSDILINRVNSDYLVGKSGIVPNNFGSATFESKNIRVRVDKKSCYPQFLNYYFNSKLYFHQIMSLIKTAVAQVTINQDDLNQLLIPVPSLEEQQRITSILNEINSKINDLKSKKAHFESLKQGLMQKLLAGQIRVKV